MSDHEIIVEQLLVRSVEAQNRTTHAIRAWVSLVITSIISAMIAGIFFWLAPNAHRNSVQVLFALGYAVAIIGTLVGVSLAIYEYSKSGAGLKNDVTDFS